MADLTATPSIPLTREMRTPLAQSAAPYVVGVALILAAHGVALMIRTPHVPTAYTIFVAAVVLTALYGGFGPGLLVTALASFDLTSLLVSPHISSVETTKDPALIAACGSAALLSGALRRPRGVKPPTLDVLLAATERERRRIGHDLHDGLGQELTGISLLTSALAERLRSEGSTAAQQADELATLVRESIRHAADLARGLSPADLADGGLVVALRRLCTNVGRLPGVTCSLVTRGDERFEPEAAVHLYRIVQEATGNALRHGAAKTINVALSATGDALTLRIADDGDGFDTSLIDADGPAGATAGLGLRLMAHRAAAIGGTLHVGSRVTRGTVVTCHVPHGGASRD